MGNPFFSVIVPAHNSEAYLAKCLDSILMQTFRDFELIVVCDACTDRTFHIANKYTIGTNHKVLLTEYGMDGLARNAGIDAAEGEWILFLDDDDWWIHEYVLEEIHKEIFFIDGYGIGGARIDMLCFDFIWKGRGYASVQPDKMNIAVWSKAFRRSLIGDTRFPAIPFTSDQPFMDEIIAKRPGCMPLNKLMYYYNYMWKGSQTEEHEHGGGAE